MEVRARSKAARKVWDKADKFTRDTLGFSVLHVVRDNPTSLIASGVHYQHPEGVLYLTQFTQVAMATVAAAQVAEMREQGAFVEGAIACGHSVGEYTALACVVGVFAAGGAAGGRVPPRQQDARHRPARRVGPLQLPAGRDPARRRSTCPTTTSRTSSPTSPSAPVSSCRSSTSTCAARSTRSPARCAVWKRSRKRSSGAARSPAASGRSSSCRASTCRSTREVLRVGVADFRRSLERVMPRDEDPDADHRALHPEPGAAAVHAGSRLHPGDPRSGARRAARRDPRRLRHLA